MALQWLTYAFNIKYLCVLVSKAMRLTHLLGSTLSSEAARL